MHPRQNGRGEERALPKERQVEGRVEEESQNRRSFFILFFSTFPLTFEKSDTQAKMQQAKMISRSQLSDFSHMHTAKIAKVQII